MQSDPKEMTPEEIAEKARQGFQAFKLWFESTDIKIIGTEMPLVSEKYRFGGTPDAIGKTSHGGYVLIDYKTSNRIYGETMLPQLAAYGVLLRENEVVPHPIERFHLLRLGKDYGDFHHHSFPREALTPAWESFKLMLQVYTLKKELKRIAGT